MSLYPLSVSNGYRGFEPQHVVVRWVDKLVDRKSDVTQLPQASNRNGVQPTPRRWEFKLVAMPNVLGDTRAHQM